MILSQKLTICYEVSLVYVLKQSLLPNIQLKYAKKNKLKIQRIWVCSEPLVRLSRSPSGVDEMNTKLAWELNAGDSA